MRIEGDDVVYAHIDQLFKCERTVQRLTAAALMLAAFIKERHDDRNTFSSTDASRDHSFHILEMIVGGHVV